MRWRLVLEEVSTELIYIKGSKYIVALMLLVENKLIN